MSRPSVLFALFALMLLSCFVFARTPRSATETLLVEIAGRDARHCGMIRLREDRGAAIRCAARAMAAGESFLIGFQLQGIDSQVWAGVARRAGSEMLKVVYDSDTYGHALPVLGTPRSSQSPCASPNFPREQFDRFSCQWVNRSGPTTRRNRGQTTFLKLGGEMWSDHDSPNHAPRA